MKKSVFLIVIYQFQFFLSIFTNFETNQKIDSFLISSPLKSFINQDLLFFKFKFQRVQKLIYPHSPICKNHNLMQKPTRGRGRNNKIQQPIKLEQLNDAHILIENQQPQEGAQNPFCYDQDQMQQVYQQEKQPKNFVKVKFDSSDNQEKFIKNEDVRIFTQQNDQQYQKQQQFVAKIKKQFTEDKIKLDRISNTDQSAKINQQSLSLQKSLDQVIHRDNFKGIKKQNNQSQQLDQPIQLLKYQGIIPIGKFSTYTPSTKPQSFQPKQRGKMSEKKLQQIIKYFKKYEEFLKNQTRYDKKMSLKKFAIDIGIDPSTIYQFYYDFLMDPTLSQKFIGIRQISKRTTANNVTLNRMRKLKQMLRVNPFMTQNEMMDRLLAEPDCKGRSPYQLEKPMISRLLRSMNYSKKKILRIPKLKNTPLNIQKRYQFSVEYKRIKQQQKAIIYYFDECAFNLFTMRDMAWSQRGQPVQYKQATPMSKNVSLSLIISSNGIQQWQIKKGTFKKHHIMLFLQKFFKKVQARGQLKYKEYLLFDNCPIHEYQPIKNLAAKYCKINIMLLPPYTPQMNPIETWFHDMKMHVRKGTQMTQEQLILQINKAVKKYKTYDFSHYYAGLLVHAERGIKKEKF